MVAAREYQLPGPAVVVRCGCNAGLTQKRPPRSLLAPRAVIISNPTVSKAEAAANKYRLDAHSGDAMDVINHPDVEAVWICSPSQFHADQIKACAAAGKHVFCEKPIATDLSQTSAPQPPEARGGSRGSVGRRAPRGPRCASTARVARPSRACPPRVARSRGDQRVQRGRREADDRAAAPLRPQLQAREGGDRQGRGGRGGADQAVQPRPCAAAV